jgi:hypothetical protein
MVFDAIQTESTMDITLDPREHASVIAGLRALQHLMFDQACDEQKACIMELASNGGTVMPLSARQIDSLCARIN